MVIIITLVLYFPLSINFYHTVDFLLTEGNNVKSINFYKIS